MSCIQKYWEGTTLGHKSPILFSLLDSLTTLQQLTSLATSAISNFLLSLMLVRSLHLLWPGSLQLRRLLPFSEMAVLNSVLILSLCSPPQESHLTSCVFNWAFSVDSSQTISCNSSFFLKVQTQVPYFLQGIFLRLFPKAQTEVLSLLNLFLQPSFLFPLMVPLFGG